MTVPALRLSTDTATTVTADLVVLGVAAGKDGPTLLTDNEAFSSIAASLGAIGATGGVDELLRIPAPEGVAASIALVGLGSEPLSPNSLRYAAGTAGRRLRGVMTLALELPTSSTADVAAVLEGAAIGAYSYNRYRSAPKPNSLPAQEIVVITAVTDDVALVTRATTIATAIGSVRDLVNAPASDLYPETFVDAVLERAEGLPVTVEVFDEVALAEGGFGGILGVGQGSIRPPRLIKIAYTPDHALSGHELKHLAIVGKGITFDSGGLSLKPASSMVGMKDDMTGAATAMAVVFAAAELSVATRLTAWLCVAENMPSGSAVRPNDVLTIRGGTTVEVLNTDAEGRIVMADGLVAASEEFPDAIVDVATLTGAQRVALGERYSGVMGDDTLVASVIAAAQTTGELMWAMPLPGELRAGLNSDVADIANARMGNTAGGMMLAGVFLREFVGPQRNAEDGKIPWAHLDIAAPAYNTGSPHGFTGKGPTGVSVRTLLALAEDISRA
jgi:leucyl aminopeptidase